MSKRPSMSPYLTFSETIAARLLGCTTSEVLEMEARGLLKHNPFWRDHGRREQRSGFFPDYWEHYDVRHYDVDDVLALMPVASEMANHLRKLKRRSRNLLAAQVGLASAIPYLLVKVTRAGGVSSAFGAAKGTRKAAQVAAQTWG